MGQTNAKEDLQRYRDGYPGLEDDPEQNDNLLFYQNKMPSRPSGDLIDVIHVKWWGDFELLERHHGYIQWLFPIREHGMNMQSQVLQPHEIDGLRKDPLCQQRLVKSYCLMLDFYGLKMVDKETGKIARADHYKSRYSHLNHSFHNYLRITRILKSLGETGFEHYKIHFLELMVKEVFDVKVLYNCRRSLTDFWAPTLRDDTQRAELLAKIDEYLHVDEDEEDEDEDTFYTNAIREREQEPKKKPPQRKLPERPDMPVFKRNTGKPDLSVKPEDYWIDETEGGAKNNIDENDELGEEVYDQFASHLDESSDLEEIEETQPLDEVLEETANVTTEAKE